MQFKLLFFLYELAFILINAVDKKIYFKQLINYQKVMLKIKLLS
jgi:hypothetical protein